MFRVSDFLWRGPLPTLQDLIDHKIRIKLSLKNEIDDFFVPDQLEAVDLPGKYGIFPLSEPLSDLWPAGKERLESINRLIDKYANEQVGPILVHCETGKDRTGIVIAYRRVTRDKWTPDEAIAEWKAYGLHPWYYWWIPFFRWAVR